MTLLKKGEQSKQEIIKCAAHLFWKNGYNATGISDILEAAALPKGSFYYYFKTKRDLAAEVSSYYEHYLHQLFFNDSSTAIWREFIPSMTRFMTEIALEDKHLGCPLAVVGMEIAISEPDMSTHYSNSLLNLGKTFQQILIHSGIPKENSDDLSKQALAVYEGHLLLYRITKDVRHFDLMREALLSFCP